MAIAPTITARSGSRSNRRSTTRPPARDGAEEHGRDRDRREAAHPVGEHGDGERSEQQEPAAQHAGHADDRVADVEAALDVRRQHVHRAEGELVDQVQGEEDADERDAGGAHEVHGRTGRVGTSEEPSGERGGIVVGSGRGVEALGLSRQEASGERGDIDRRLRFPCLHRPSSCEQSTAGRGIVNPPNKKPPPASGQVAAPARWVWGAMPGHFEADSGMSA